jgi:tetratricopeptide (TPR) repeat protein
MRQFELLSRVAAGLLAAVLTMPVSAFEAELGPAVCGSLENHYGPHDYSNLRDRLEKLPIVERFHFTQDIAALRADGKVQDHLGRHIAYTLHTFPNHHVALDAMSRLGVQQSRGQPLGARYTVECYFERAIRWRPTDPTVRLVYAIHHYRNERLDAAIKELTVGLELAPDNPELHYNLGLIALRSQDYELSIRHAKRAYELGYPLPGLRTQLERLGKWRD